MQFDPQYLESYVSPPHHVRADYGDPKNLLDSGSSLSEGDRSEE
jgi:hypothetical protein